MLIAHIAIFLQRLGDDLFQLQRKLGFDLPGRHGLPVQDGIEDEPGCAPRERMLARGHLVEHCPEGEQIRAAIEILAPHLLRRHVSHRPQRRAGAGERFLRKRCRRL